MSAETCETCRFFLAADEPGYCRRFPPSVSVFRKPIELNQPPTFDVISEFPRMRPEGWCGEWRPIGKLQ